MCHVIIPNGNVYCLFYTFTHSEKIALNSEIRSSRQPASLAPPSALLALAVCIPTTLTSGCLCQALKPIRKLSKCTALRFCRYHSCCSRCYLWLIVRIRDPNFYPFPLWHLSQGTRFHSFHSCLLLMSVHTDSGPGHVTCFGQ